MYPNTLIPVESKSSTMEEMLQEVQNSFIQNPVVPIDMWQAKDLVDCKVSVENRLVTIHLPNSTLNISITYLMMEIRRVEVGNAEFAALISAYQDMISTKQDINSLECDVSCAERKITNLQEVLNAMAASK